MKNSTDTSSLKIRVLVVEDHIALAQNMVDYFEGSNLELDFASDGLTALQLISTTEYDVIALDLGLPGVDGYDICTRLRQDLSSSTPVIIMSAEGQLSSKERCFELGADDYLVKPFKLKELELRILALHRRANQSNTPTINVGKLSYDPGSLTLQQTGEDNIELNGKAAEILELIMRKHPNYISYKELRYQIWGGRDIGTNVIRTHIYSLRKQISINDNSPMIETLHGKGVRLVCQK